MKFVTAIDEEIASLEADLGTDPRYVKLRELCRVRALYVNSDTSFPADIVPRGVVPMRGAFSGIDRKRRETSPMRTAALNEARKIVRGREEPTKTAVIFSALSARNIEIGGSDPQSNLSAMLSNHPDFVSHGRVGWTLKENEPSSDIAVGPDAADEGAPPPESASDHSNSPARGS
jgi:hypothetical protein